jgi:hypothetical protein
MTRPLTRRQRYRDLAERLKVTTEDALPIYEPVTTRDRLQSYAAQPMRGGDAAPPRGGLFDDDARNQLDLLA